MRAFWSVKYAGGGEGFQRPLWPIFIILITLATILENDERLKKKAPDVFYFMVGKISNDA